MNVSQRIVSLLGNLEYLYVVAPTKNISILLSSVPSFSKLRTLKIKSLWEPAVFQAFAKAAFGLGPDELSLGSLRDIRSLSIREAPFESGSRTPLVRAILRTAPRLTRLSLPSKSSTPNSIDTHEYGEVMKALSTSKYLTHLSMALVYPYINWAPLRTVTTLLRLTFVLDGELKVPSSSNNLWEHIRDNDLAFVWIRAPSFLAPAVLLPRILALYTESKDFKLETKIYREVLISCLRAPRHGFSVGVLGLLAHPVLLRASQDVPSAKFSELGVLDVATEAEIDTHQLRDVVALEKRFEEVLRQEGRVVTFVAVRKALRNVISWENVAKSPSCHDLLLESFPAAFSLRDRFLAYLEGPEPWIAQAKAILDQLPTADAPLLQFFDFANELSPLFEKVIQAYWRSNSALVRHIFCAGI